MIALLWLGCRATPGLPTGVLVDGYTCEVAYTFRLSNRDPCVAYVCVPRSDPTHPAWVEVPIQDWEHACDPDQGVVCGTEKKVAQQVCTRVQ